jgi:hypothetical protein
VPGLSTDVQSYLAVRSGTEAGNQLGKTLKKLTLMGKTVSLLWSARVVTK